MSRPLPPGDPVQLGPYRLEARLAETQAGIVYLGVDESGRRASVAVLNRGAAGDAAARDRFRAAITSSLPGPEGVPRSGPEDPAPVVAAQPEGPAPWVATSYDADRVRRAGAERFLEPVVLKGAFRGRWAGRRRGPQFQPYWLGSGEPALERPPVPEYGAGPPVAPERPPARNLVGGLLTLAAILVVLVLLMSLLFACRPKVSQPPPQPPDPPSQPTQPPPTPTRSGGPPPTPRPAPTGSPAPTPSPSPSDGEAPEEGPPI